MKGTWQLRSEILDRAFDVVRKMLQLPAKAPIPSEVEAQLRRVDKLLENVGGALESRQLIALIVAQWQSRVEIGIKAARSEYLEGLGL